jgi:hypothetical protein
MLRPTFWLELLLGDWRTNPSGTAVCILNTQSFRTRLKVISASLALSAAGIVLVSFANLTWPVFIVLALLASLYLPIVRHNVSPSGVSARRQLRRTRPPGPLVAVHTVASIEAGAGRALLEKLNAEADTTAWTLTLDAANENLARYYTQLGYQALGPPVLMPYGQRVVPMIRHPRLQPAAP